MHSYKGVPACWPDISCHKKNLAFAKKQTVVGIYWQGIQKLGGVPNKLSKDDVMDWMGAYTKIIQGNTIIDDAVKRLTKFVRNNDISCFVFNVQTVASYYYLSPEMWTSGDVDFYLFKKNWTQAKS